MKRKLINILGALALVSLFTTQVFAKEMTVQGRLQRTVEPGGWVIAAGNQKYLILNSQRFQNEKWFAEGNEVEASRRNQTRRDDNLHGGHSFRSAYDAPFSSKAAPAEIKTMLRGLTKVLVTGDSIVQAQPDTAILTVSVVTQGRTLWTRNRKMPIRAMRSCGR